MTPTTLLLLPGLDGTGTLFAPLLKHLPPQLHPQIIAYPPREKLAYPALLDRILQALPPAGPFIILGESFSGPLALMVAATRPPRLQAVILAATFIRNPFWIRSPHLARLLPAWPFRLYPLYSRSKSFLSRRTTPALRAAAQAAIATVPPAILAHRVRQALQVNVTRQLTDCPVPLLDLRAAHDWVVPRHNAREIARLLPSLTQTTFPSSHMLLQTHPAESTAAILHFLNA